MRYLLDTCVISELVKAVPNPQVVAWINQQDEEKLYLSALTFGELHKGIAKLPSSKRKKTLHQWVEYELQERFGNRTLAFDAKVAKVWGEAQGASEKAGRPMPAIDSLIAATGLAHDLIVATRNTADMEQSGVNLFNPWE